MSGEITLANTATIAMITATASVFQDPDGTQYGTSHDGKVHMMVQLTQAAFIAAGMLASNAQAMSDAKNLATWFIDGTNSDFLAFRSGINTIRAIP